MADSLPQQHEAPEIAPNMSAADYVARARQMHEALNPSHGADRVFYPVFSWIGNAMLAVPPINRMCSAIGLTAGLTAGGALARLLGGHQFSGAAIPVESYPTLLRPLHNVMKYDPLEKTGATAAKKFGMSAIFSAFGAIGVGIGSTLAYRSTYKRNRHPEFLEDYDARASQEQADAWTPLTALTAIFGSSSGTSLIPLPGVNYAISLATRTTLMQNRNNMTPGAHGFMSGTQTTSYMSLREGLNDLVKYAVHNPARTPERFEYKVFHLLSQIFPDVKAEQVQQFVNKIHELRDPYLEEGGVPREKQKELESKLTKAFTKAGFETTLIEIGLNPRSVRLVDMNGAMGWMGNKMGAAHRLAKLQQEFDAKLEARHPGLPKEGHFLPSKEPNPDALTEVPVAQKAPARPAAQAEERPKNSLALSDQDIAEVAPLSARKPERALAGTA